MFKQGDKVTLITTVIAGDYNRLNYPEVQIEQGESGLVFGGPSPCVNRRGTFYTVTFGSHRIAVKPEWIRRNKSK